MVLTAYIGHGRFAGAADHAAPSNGKNDVAGEGRSRGAGDARRGRMNGSMLSSGSEPQGDREQTAQRPLRQGWALQGVKAGLVSGEGLSHAALPHLQGA